MANRFKFRAEAPIDIERLSRLLADSKAKAVVLGSQDEGFPDCEAVIETELSLLEIRDFMLKVVDGHVMAETIAEEHAYTGVRRYDT